jgi:sulfur-carrier protein
VVVRYFADIRSLTGREEESLDEAAPTLGALLEALGRVHGAAFRDRALEGGRLSSTLIVLVNGRNVEHLRGLETPLVREDVVSIFPMVAGG